MMTIIPDLSFEIDGDAIDLEQDAGCGSVSRITLHPVHLQLLAECTGMLTPSSNLEADRTIAKLSRQMRILLDRINQLDDWLNLAAQRGHEDLELENTYSFATWELAKEFCTDLPKPYAAPASDTTQNTLGNGVASVAAGSPPDSSRGDRDHVDHQPPRPAQQPLGLEKP
jgi:hypothetical protein